MTLRQVRDVLVAMDRAAGPTPQDWVRTHHGIAINPGGFCKLMKPSRDRADLHMKLEIFNDVEQLERWLRQRNIDLAKTDPRKADLLRLAEAFEAGCKADAMTEELHADPR